MKDILLAILSSFKKLTSKSRFPNIENILFHFLWEIIPFFTILILIFTTLLCKLDVYCGRILFFVFSRPNVCYGEYMIHWHSPRWNYARRPTLIEATILTRLIGKNRYLRRIVAGWWYNGWLVNARQWV